MNSTTSILVVDDEPAIREVLERLLSARGYRVLTAPDGSEALAILESQSVDLIVADISMPRMNGYQLYQHVVENPQWVAIPFLFLTAHAQDSPSRCQHRWFLKLSSKNAAFLFHPVLCQ